MNYIIHGWDPRGGREFPAETKRLVETSAVVWMQVRGGQYGFHVSSRRVQAGRVNKFGNRGVSGQISGQEGGQKDYKHREKRRPNAAV